MQTKNIIIDKNKTLHYLSFNKKIRCFILETKSEPHPQAATTEHPEEPFQNKTNEEPTHKPTKPNTPPVS
jgi:hypothetical protein